MARPPLFPIHLPTRTRREFDRIRRDRTRGAHALADAALRALDPLLGPGTLPPARLTEELALEVARTLERAQPAMGPFLRWAGDWSRIARVHPDPVRLRRARTWLRQEKRWSRREAVRLARTAKRAFPRAVDRVITISRSESVRRALDAAAGRRGSPPHVLCLESLPGGEGRRFARDLRSTGVPARAIADDEGRRAVREADLLLVGADAVFSDGSLVHKVGTRPLALAAFRAGVPVIVVAGRAKFTRRRRPPGRLPSPFDLTPGRLVDEYWTDVGRLAGPARGGWLPRTPPF